MKEFVDLDLDYQMKLISKNDHQFLDKENHNMINCACYSNSTKGANEEAVYGGLYH
jgi:hypothetical protein